jgi:Delta3-Delta2-enoyl-CoA isomerase
MQLIALEQKAPAYIMRMQGEGAFTPALVAEINDALDTIESSTGPSGLVITGDGKSFSTGFDLDIFFKGSPSDVQALMNEAVKLLGRMLSLSVPSAAAINGHVFGMGAMLALSCDYRYMRYDRGFFCLPEIDLKVPIPRAMTELLKLKLRPEVLRDLLLTGERIGGEEACRRGIVDEACTLEELMPRTIARITAHANKDRATYAALKRGLYHDAIRVIEKPGKLLS